MKLTILTHSINLETLINDFLSDIYRKSTPLQNVRRIAIVGGKDYSQDVVAEVRMKCSKYDVELILDDSIVTDTIMKSRLNSLRRINLQGIDHVLMTDDDFILDQKGVDDLIEDMKCMMKSPDVGMIKYRPGDHIDFELSGVSTNPLSVTMDNGMMISTSKLLNSVMYSSMNIDEVLKVQYHEEAMLATLLWVAGYDIKKMYNSFIHNRKVTTSLGYSLERKMVTQQVSSTKSVLNSMNSLVMDPVRERFYPVPGESWIPYDRLSSNLIEQHFNNKMKLTQ